VYNINLHISRYRYTYLDRDIDTLDIYICLTRIAYLRLAYRISFIFKYILYNVSYKIIKKFCFLNIDWMKIRIKIPKQYDCVHKKYESKYPTLGYTK